MPDQFSSLDALGIGQLEGQQKVPELEKINFTDIPSYLTQPNNLKDQISSPGIYDPIGASMKPSDMNNPKPAPYNSNSVAKQVNSVAWKELGYNRDANEEARYDSAQPWWEATKNAFVKLGVRTWDSFTDFLHQNVDTFNSLTNAKLADSWKNETELQQIAKDQRIENLYPSFRSKDGPQWYSFIPFTKGSGDFYEQFLPQLGFTLGMMGGAVLENTLVTALTGGAGEGAEAANTLRKMYGAITGFNNIRKAAMGAEGLLAGKNLAVNGLKIGATGWNFYNTAASEAALEGAMNYNQTKQQLVQEYKDAHGYEPIGSDAKKIDDASTKAGSATFGWNIPVLMVSNGIQFGNLLFPAWAKKAAFEESIKGYELGTEGVGLDSKIVSRKVADKSFRDVWKDGNILDRSKLLLGYLGNAKNTWLTEGYEEIAQDAISSGTSQHYMDQYNGKNPDMGDSIGYGLGQMFTTQGWQDFLGGALSGLFFEKGQHGLKHFATPHELVNEDGTKSYKESWLNRIGLYSDKFVDSQRGERAANIAEMLNHDTLKDVLKDEGFKDLFIATRNSARMKQANSQDDLFNMKNLRSDALNRFIYSGLTTGKLDLRLQQLKDLKNLSEDELTQIFNLDYDANNWIGDNKPSLHRLIDRIGEKAEDFQKVYDREGPRFDNEIKQAFKDHQAAEQAHKNNESRVKQKYNKESTDQVFEPLNSFSSQINEELNKAKTHDELDDVMEKVRSFNESNSELLDDFNSLRNTRKVANFALFNLAAIQEGKKAAVLAYADMKNASTRSENILKNLKKSDTRVNFHILESLMDKNSIDDEIRNQKSRIYKESPDLDHIQNNLNILDKIKQMHADKETPNQLAEQMLKYVEANSPKQDKSSVFSYDYSDKSKGKALRDIQDIVRLQRAHQDNLDLYNRLIAVSQHRDPKAYESDAVTSLLNGVYNSFTKAQAEDQTEGSINKTPQQPKQTTGNIQNIQNNAQTSTQASGQTENQASPTQPTQTTTSDSQRQEAPYKKGDLVLHGDSQEYVHDIVKDPTQEGAYRVSFDSNPSKFVSATEIEPFSIEPLQDPVEPTTYIRELETEFRDDEKADQQNISAHREKYNQQGNRTIVNEVTDKLQDGMPILDPNTAWRQNFLDNINADTIGRNYQLFYTIDKAENYPADSKEAEWLKTHQPGLVLEVRDRNGNRLFNDAYVADPNGKPLVFSLTSSDAKQSLLGTMRDQGITEVPARLGRVSHGMVDRAPHYRKYAASELVKGIPATSYNLMIASTGVPGEGAVLFDISPDTKLRNGGFYIQLNGAYIKLTPMVAANLTVPGVVGFDVASLLNNRYWNAEEAVAVRKMLETIFYTSTGRDGIRFIAYKVRNSYRVEAQVIKDDRYLSMSPEQLMGALNVQRLNVARGSLGKAFTVYTVEGGNLKAHQIDYNEFILNNTTTDKTAYVRDGQKVLKPVDRYMTTTESLDEIKDGLLKQKQLEQQEKAKEENPNVNLAQQNRRQPKNFRELGDNEGPEGPQMLREKTKGVYEPLAPEEVKFIKERFGENAVQVYDVANSNAWGLWTKSGITLFKDAASGTGYHEAWHHFTQMYLTKEQKTDLYNEVRERVPSLRKASNLEVEEHLAEDFRGYVQTGDSKILDGRPKSNNIFRMMLDFLKRIFGSRQTIDRAYRELRTGNLYGYRPSVNNSAFGTLYSRIYNRQGEELFSTQKGSRYISYMDSLVGNILASNKMSPSWLTIDNPDIRTKNRTTVYRQLYSTLTNEYNNLTEQRNLRVAQGHNVDILDNTLDDLEKIIANYRDVFNEYTRKSFLNIMETDPDEQQRFEKEIDQIESDTQEITDSVDADAEKEAEFSSRWERAGNEESLIQSSSEETKALIRTLSKVQVDRDGYPVVKDGKVQLERNNYGLTEPVNFTKVFNNLGILLEGSQSYAEMVNRMKDRENQRKYPEMALLLERLPSDADRMTLADVQSLTRFAKDFGKVYVPIYTLLRMNDSKEGFVAVFKEETKRTKDLIKKQWSNNFITKNTEDPDVKAGRILLDENKRPYVTSDLSKLNYNFGKQEDVESFLGLLGIQLSRFAKESPEYREIVNPTSMRYLYNGLINRIKKGIKVGEPVANLGREENEINSESKTLNRLYNLEAKYTTEAPSLSYRNAEGNMQHGLSLPMYILQNNYWLSNTKNYGVIRNTPEAQHLNSKNNPYVMHSLFLSKLFDMKSPDGVRRTVQGDPVVVEIGNYNGVKDVRDQNEDSQGSQGASTTGLNGRGKLIMDFNSLLSSGAVEIMRTESSGSAFFVKLSDYGSDERPNQKLPFPTEMLKGGVDNPQLLNTMFGYFIDELASIINVYNSKLPGYNDERTGPGRFSLFKGIIPESTQNEIYREIENSKAETTGDKIAVVEKLMAKHVDTVNKHVQRFFMREANELLDEFDKRGITEADISSKLKAAKDEYGNTREVSLSELATSFIVNDFILNTEYSKLFSGNVAFYKAYHKRSKADISTGTKPVTDRFLVDYLRDTHNRTMAASMGLQAETDISKTNAINIKDDERASKYISHMKENFRRLNPHLAESEIDEIVGKDSAYGKMNVADGQGHSTLDFYRKFRMATGTWQDADERMYMKEVIQFRRDNDLYKNLAETQKAQDDAFMEQNKDVVSWFPSVKMQYNGPLDIQGVYAPVNDKFSIHPLIPSIIKGTQWDHMNKQMVLNNIGYSKFESGTKKYKFPPVNLYGDYSGDWSKAIEPKNIASHFTMYLKEQVATKSEPKTTSTWGTQMRKLFMANLFNSGASLQKFRDILDRYKGLLNSIEDEQKRNLYREFGIEASGPDTFRVAKAEAFIANLQSEVERRRLNDNIKDSIQAANGQFAYPLEINLNKAVVQDLISGMVFKRLTQLKINGDMLIQVASSGYEAQGFNYKSATEEDIQKYGTNGLPFYTMQYDKNGNPTGTTAMGVKIALTKEWKKLLEAKHTDGQKIGTLERLNQLIKDENWIKENHKSITMIGYRIPTQGPNSMEVMQVHEFLPEVAGSVIILPAEIVAKSGSDYDIDKMNIFRPSFTSNGEIISRDNIDRLDKQKVDLEKKMDDLFRQIGERTYGEGKVLDHILNSDLEDEEVEQELQFLDKKDISDTVRALREMRNARKALYTNEVMDLYREVLQSPDMYTQLVTPNSTNLVKPVATDIGKRTDKTVQDFQDTDILRYKSNLTKFEQLLSGKRELGAYALSNTIMQLYQQSGMRINQNYKILTGSKESPKVLNRQVTLKLFNPQERADLMRDGKIDYSSVNNMVGLPKQEYSSQLINSTVDVASDPYYSSFGLNNETLGVGLHLLNMGLPFPRIIKFLNQPIIRLYLDAMTRYQMSDKKGRIQEAILQYHRNVDTDENKRGHGGRAYNFAANLDAKNANDHFSEEFLDSVIDASGHNHMQYIADAIVNRNQKILRDQQRIFAHFMMLQEQAGIARELQATINFDTVKFLTPISVESNLLLRNKVTTSDLFDKDAVDSIRNNSMISAFNTLETNKAINAAIMPVGMSNVIINESAKLMQEYRAGKIARLKLERVLNNDWIEFIIKNFGDVNGYNIEIYADALLRERENAKMEVLAQRLGELKTKYPSLENYELVRRLYANMSKVTPELKNVELYRGLDNSSDLQNILIENYEELKNFTGDEVVGSTFSDAQAADIRDYFTKLQYLAFHQSGFNRSPISFLDVVPHEELSRLFTNALSRFSEFIKGDTNVERNMATAFTAKFRTQNPVFKLYESQVSRDTLNQESWRGKYYRINLDSLGKVVPLQQRLPMAPTGEDAELDYADPTEELQAPEEQKALPPSQPQGINISTRSDDALGRALTNPVWGSKKDGKNYLDVESIYKATKSKNTDPTQALREDMNTMYQLIVQKFKQNPELVQQITDRGGVAFLEASSHEVGVRNSRWEGKGTNSNFIRVLIEAYKASLPGDQSKALGADISKAYVLATRVFEHVNKKTTIFSEIYKNQYAEGKYESVLDMLRDQLSQGGTAYVNTVDGTLNGDDELATQIMEYFEQQDKDAQDRIDGCMS